MLEVQKVDDLSSGDFFTRASAVMHEASRARFGPLVAEGKFENITLERLVSGGIFVSFFRKQAGLWFAQAELVLPNRHGRLPLFKTCATFDTYEPSVPVIHEEVTEAMRPVSWANLYRLLLTAPRLTEGVLPDSVIFLRQQLIPVAERRRLNIFHPQGDFDRIVANELAEHQITRTLENLTSSQARGESVFEGIRRIAPTLLKKPLLVFLAALREVPGRMPDDRWIVGYVAASIKAGRIQNALEAVEVLFPKISGGCFVTLIGRLTTHGQLEECAQTLAKIFQRWENRSAYFPESDPGELELYFGAATLGGFATKLFRKLSQGEQGKLSLTGATIEDLIIRTSVWLRNSSADKEALTISLAALAAGLRSDKIANHVAEMYESTQTPKLQSQYESIAKECGFVSFQSSLDPCLNYLVKQAARHPLVSSSAQDRLLNEKCISFLLRRDCSAEAGLLVDELPEETKTQREQKLMLAGQCALHRFNEVLMNGIDGTELLRELYSIESNLTDLYLNKTVTVEQAPLVAMLAVLNVCIDTIEDDLRRATRKVHGLLLGNLPLHAIFQSTYARAAEALRFTRSNSLLDWEFNTELRCS